MLNVCAFYVLFEYMRVQLHKRISKAQKCSAITFFDIAKIRDAKPEGDSGVKPGQALKIAVRRLDIRKAYKKHINVA